MRVRACFFVILVFLYSLPALSQVDSVSPQASELPKPDKTPSRSLNIDMQLTYGMYNNILSTINLSQETENFVYLLNSNFKRSNDFGYNDEVYFNTSYQENKIGFTGNVTMADGWKTLFEASVDGGSYGMYENPVYVREEKERYGLLMKNILRTSSIEWYLTANYSGYTHRLAARDNDNNEKSSLNKMSGEFGGEYIMSASNRIKWGGIAAWYRYNDDVSPYDLSVRGSIVDDFRITTTLGLSMGLNTAWDRDADMLRLKLGKSNSASTPVSPTGGITFKGESAITASVQYKYDLEPFKPENLFFEQKYIFPEYTFDPSQAHIVEAKADIKGNDFLSLKLNSVYKKSQRYYNYAADARNVLRAHEVEVQSVASKADISIKIAESGIVFETGYEYAWFKADERITYRPSHIVNESIKYNGDNWKAEWGNKYISKTLVDPQLNRALSPAVIGMCGIQFQMVRGFYTYARVENLYNNRYNLREGYPEPGLVVLGGLRILM